MTSPHILFTAPLALRITAPSLFIDGALRGYFPGVAYEGRLEIVNGIGACTVELVAGDLPNGAVVRVDGAADEVVIAWPEFDGEPTTSVPNGSFEAGDRDWTKGAGWSIGTGAGFDPYSGTWSAAYNGSGSSYITGPMVPAFDPVEIAASVQVQQGASSAGSVGAGVMLFWYGTDRKPLPGGEGQTYSSGSFVSSGSNGQWNISTILASRPYSARYVAIGARADRKRQSSPLWIDAFSWDHEYIPGQNDPTIVYAITIRVTDSAGRSAYWSGEIHPREPITWDGTWDSFQITGGSPTSAGYSIPTFIPAIEKYLSKSASDSVACVMSEDYLTWNAYGSAVGFGFTGSPLAMAVSPSGRIVFCGRAQTYYSDNDGASWLQDGVNTYAQSMRQVSYVSGMFVAHGSGNTGSNFYRSALGKDWSISYPLIGGIHAIAYSPILGLHVAVGDSGAASSPDGVTWTAMTGDLPVSSGGTSAATWAFDRFLCTRSGVGRPGVYQSLDGLSWEPVGSLVVDSGISTLSYVPELGEVIFTNGVKVYRHAPGSTVFTACPNLPYTPSGGGFCPKSGQVMLVLPRIASPNLLVTKVDY
jgi:hypothetical protein